MKNLKEDVFYLLNNSFKISVNSDEDKLNIKYNPEKNIKLYDSDKFRINVSAIVGKNGSGKSSITDLLFSIINNIAYPEFNKDNDDRKPLN